MNGEDATGAGASPSNPASALAEVVARLGPAAATDARRCRAALADFGIDSRLSAALAAAAESGAAAEVTERRFGESDEARVTRLAGMVHSRTAIDPTLARWAVETWAYAVGPPPEQVAVTAPPPPGAAPAPAAPGPGPAPGPATVPGQAGPPTPPSPPTEAAVPPPPPPAPAPPPPAGGGQPGRKRALVLGAVGVVALAVLVVVVLVVMSGGGGSNSSFETFPTSPATSASSTSGPSTTATGGPVSTLTTADVPSGYTRVDGFKALGLAACAGAVDRPTSVKDQQAIVSFTKDASPTISEVVTSYRSGADAEYAILARGAADCRSRAGTGTSGVIEATPLDVGAVGDERTAVALSLGDAAHPSDAVRLQFAAIRVGSTVISINLSGSSIPAGLTSDLAAAAVAKLA